MSPEPNYFGRRLNVAEASIARTAPPPPSNGKTPVAPPSNAIAAKETKGFEARQPQVRLQDVVLPEETLQDIRRLIACVRNYEKLARWAPKVFDPQRRYMAMNFYGLPGTGKTMCVDAIASELGVSVLEVNYAELESELWGKSSKNIHLAFQRATEQNAILFFDEADSVLGARINNPGHSSDQHLNLSRSVLLKQLDHFAGIVMFATNLERNYDRAFVRRIFQHVEIPLPNVAGRRLLWQKMLTSALPGFEELNFEALANASEGLSGGDLTNAIRQSLPAIFDRPGQDQTARTQDLLRCVDEIKRSKQRIGAREPSSFGDTAVKQVDIGVDRLIEVDKSELR